MPSANQQTHQGQTLIETLVTILILAIGIIALVQFQNYLAYDNSLAQQQGDAMLLALKEIETVKDFHVLNDTSGYTSYQSISSATTTSAGTTTTYTITRTVTSFTNPTYKTVGVTVSWTDRRGGAQSINLVSTIAGINPSNSAVVM